MSNFPLGRIGTQPDALGVEPRRVAEEAGGEGFAQTLMDALKEVNQAQQDASAMRDDFMAGRRNVELHELLITMERSSIAMALTMQVRNKMLEAYTEVSRMQV